MNKKIFIFPVLLVAMGLQAQIQPQQSMYMYNALGINPGATGQFEALNVNFSHRTMWRGIEGAPKTQYLSMSTPLKNDHIAVGMQMTRDQIGVSSKTMLQASAAYRILMDKGKLSFGLTLGMTSASNNWSKINTTEGNDIAFNSGDISYWLPNAGAGIYYDSPFTFAGLSMPQFFTETYAGGNEYKAVNTFKNHSYHLLAGQRFLMSKVLTLQASTLVKHNSSSKTQIDLSAILKYKKIGDIGVTVRPKDAIVFIGRIEANDQLRIGYSYDVGLSNLAHYNRGTHELNVNYTFIFIHKAPNTRLF